jgi:Uncharacterized conserved protein
MAEYVYPALFHLNDDGSYTITYPDLPGCISEGKSLENALYMAQDALRVWLGYLLDEKEALPASTAIQQVQAGPGEFVNLIRAVVQENRAVRRTVSIPKWMDDQVTAAGISLSKVLQEALKARLSAE